MHADQTGPDENAMDRCSTLKVERRLSDPLMDQNMSWALPGENPTAPHEIAW